MTFRNIHDSLSDKRKDQLAVMKLAGGTKFAITGIEHDTVSDLYCLTIGSMPEEMPDKINDKQISLDDLFAEAMK